MIQQSKNLFTNIRSIFRIKTRTLWRTSKKPMLYFWSYQKAKSLVGNTDSTPLQPTIRNMLHHYFQLFTNTFLTKPQLQVKTTLSNDQLINLIDKQKQEISKIESKIDDIKKNLSNDYGSDDILRAFDLTTINKNWEVTPTELIFTLCGPG